MRSLFYKKPFHSDVNLETSHEKDTTPSRKALGTSDKARDRVETFIYIQSCLKQGDAASVYVRCESKAHGQAKE